ncbi:MAG: T9SS type A sorting domain-containing protein, partial [Candidatus Kapaibacterium sp.]
FAVLRADGKAAESKAIWVIKGNDCVVAGIDFRECAVTDRNGAGIRVEGTNITVSRCAFRQNQDGILAGSNLNSTIIVEYSEFDRSGAGDGLSHAIYINHVNAFIFRFNYSHNTLVGHECKSRAHFNYIAYNRLTNETGTGSRNLDLPNGGTSVVIGNVFHKGANAENGNVIGYGIEGMSDTVDNSLYISHNTVVSDRGLATFLRIDSKTKLLKAVNNIFVGNMSFLIGTAASADTLNNLSFATASQVGFVNPSVYDYRLLATSPARGKAVDAGSATSTVPNYRELPLAGILEYVHPCQDRIRISSRDMGAYEYAPMTSVDDAEKSAPFEIYPNPASDIVRVHADTSTNSQLITVVSLTGETVLSTTESTIDVSSLAPGTYRVISGLRSHMFVVRR